MTVTFQRETWADYFRDCQALWVEHYDELALRKDRMKMKPDVPAYEAMEAAGILDILTVREDGEMIGYVLSAVRPHLHYADTLCGFEDAYFLRKISRRGMLGVRMIREWLMAMRARWCVVAYGMTKPWLDNGPIFERLGGKLSDNVYAFWLEG